MKAEKKLLGIWMDHTKAHLIELNRKRISSETLYSDYATHERIDGEEATGARFGKYRDSNNEFSKHNKDQADLSFYYKVLADRIKNYDEVILFGPTTAKNELHNFISSDKKFSKIKLSIHQADKMSESEMNAFVKNYFQEIEVKSLI